MKRKVEILAPAGSYESLKAAVKAGADAVYMGGSRFGARAYADNPDEEMLLKAIDYVHIHGRKIYLTVNTLMKDREMDELYDYLLPYYCQGIDGVIIQDIGALAYIREHFPGLSLHASTQMTITGVPGAEFLKSRGIERIVPARELSLQEIRKMKEATGLEMECFVHGALCYCYSGQCLLSSILGGRSGNRGQCAQPCRLSYGVNGSDPKDVMSLKDLCTIDLIPDLMEAGIDSFKIEGRMKQPEYVYTVTGIYRKYVDLYNEGGRKACRVTQEDREKLQGVYRRRGYSDGYYYRHNGREMISFERPGKKADQQYGPEGNDGKGQTADYKLQENINGNLTLSSGKRAKLVVEKDRFLAEYEGAEVQRALKQPLDAARIKKQMEKTGDTPFQFQSLHISAEEGVFLPMQALNELRREGIRLLEEELLKSYRREVPDTPEHKELKKRAGGNLSLTAKDAPRADSRADSGDRTFRLAAFVSDIRQLKEVLKQDDIRTIYIDSGMGFKEETRHITATRREKKIFLAMPYIFRMDTMALFEQHYDKLNTWYDGVLIRNFESYGWLEEKAYAGEIRSDSNLYLFNRYGREFLKKTNISSYTAAAELNAKELERLGVRDCSLPVYGYQPVMVTANCIQKTMKNCTRREEILYLIDRYKKKFAVKNCCEYCYNIIYNCAPTILLDQKKEIARLNPPELRIDFTIEGPEETRRILGLYTDVFLKDKDAVMPDAEFTRGHFKRGVK